MATILIVDDDAANRLLLRTLVEHLGHRAVEGATGAEGYRLAVAERPAAVVVDLGLPDMPGTALLGRLRAGAETSAIPIALSTASTDRAMIDEVCALYRIDAIFPKPGDPRALLEEITALLAASAH